MIRVVVAARSAAVRDTIKRILDAEPDITVVALAASGQEVTSATTRQKPNIVVMGADIPEHDGMDVVEQIMIDIPTPIAIVTDRTDAGQVDVAMRALKSGALTVLALTPDDHREVGARNGQFIADIKSFAEVKVVRRWRRPIPADVQSSRSATRPASAGRKAIKIVGIAASTGGPAALQRVLSGLSADFEAPVLVVQHITLGFTTGFAQWLQIGCALKVKIAEHGEGLRPHMIYVAGDAKHLGVSSDAKILLSDTVPIGGFKPSANFMFDLIAKNYGANALGVILTGMGRDGVEGLSELHRAGGHIIAQDEASSVIYGMPGAAVGAGLAHDVLPLDEIAPRLMDLV